MAYMRESKSAAVRSKLDHPVIDGGEHWLEPLPIVLDFLEDAAGQRCGVGLPKTANVRIAVGMR